jgi:hypothetical protein
MAVVAPVGVDNGGSDITLSEIFFEVGIGDVVVSAGIPMPKSMATLEKGIAGAGGVAEAGKGAAFGAAREPSLSQSNHKTQMI